MNYHIIQLSLFWKYIWKNWKHSLEEIFVQPHLQQQIHNETLKQLQCHHRWMNKQNVMYTYNEILFKLKTKRHSEMCNDMDEPWRHNVKWNKCCTAWLHLHEVLGWPKISLVFFHKMDLVALSFFNFIWNNFVRLYCGTCHISMH